MINLYNKRKFNLLYSSYNSNNMHQKYYYYYKLIFNKIIIKIIPTEIPYLR